jgi:hypothetical protein
MLDMYLEFAIRTAFEQSGVNQQETKETLKVRVGSSETRCKYSTVRYSSRVLQTAI